jgi:hypothetical protein
MGISGLLLVTTPIASRTASTFLNFYWNLAAFVYAKTDRRALKPSGVTRASAAAVSFA